MNLLNIIRGFDSELYDFFEHELERQYYSLSFIPDENSISPLCSATMGNVLVNTQHNNTAFPTQGNLEYLVAHRLCQLFHGEHANLKSITIDVASRVVFQALVQRGDVVLSLDLRKQEHCNSESMVFRFINFGLDPQTQRLDLDMIEQQVREYQPRLVIVSPINYPHAVDYERLAAIVHEHDSILWCDISQVAGLITAGVMPSPLPHADIVTFTMQGALQGPRSSVIICKDKFANAIDRAAFGNGHSGLGSSELAALGARLQEMQTPEYRAYCQAVVENTKALAEGLVAGGMTLVGGAPDSHFVVADAKKCALSARGAIENLSDSGIMARECQVLTADPMIKFDGIRFSSLPATTRGISKEQMRKVGEAIGSYLMNPNPDHEQNLAAVVREITVPLPLFSERWLCDSVKENLEQNNYFSSSDSSGLALGPSRLSKLVKSFKHHRANSAD